ncbi:hypothetical protein HII13_004192 [Brettanomyces bruxellensis]|nr:hypothetical protein HII13_004192 [Brettanomyces bruxellensis]
MYLLGLKRVGVGSRSSFVRQMEVVRHVYNRAARRPDRISAYEQFSEYYKVSNGDRHVPELERMRLVPTNTDNSWMTFEDYQDIGGGNKLKVTQYQKLITVLRRLDSIEPELRNDEVNNALNTYRKAKDESSGKEKTKQLDDKGRGVAVGRRKASSAKVYVVEGEGNILINGKPLEEVFPIYEDRLRILLPLQVVDAVVKYNVFALARGGGKTGQIDSIKLALSKALCIHNPLYKKRLFAAGCLTRDHRVVERKKPGRRKARKMPTWVKR